MADPAAELAAARQRALTTYDAAADRYDDPANSFWDRFGRRTVERLGLRPGERVLDVCCGSGASALPAAQAVGATGRVLGVDLSERLLALARRKAAEAGLAQCEFRAGDLLDPLATGGREDGGGDGGGGGGERFDAVVCVFGIFFVPDMAAAARALWRCVRPGGRLALTTWGPRLFEPASAGFWESIRAVRPDLHKGFNPWDRIGEPAAVVALLREAGVEGAEVVAEAGEHALPSPEAWWSVVLGSGYRGTVDQLDPAQRSLVRAANLDLIRRRSIRAVEANVVYAVARRPARS